jgi:hypothetical protein
MLVFNCVRWLIFIHALTLGAFELVSISFCGILTTPNLEPLQHQHFPLFKISHSALDEMRNMVGGG